MVQEVIKVIRGRTDDLIKDLEIKMEESAGRTEFENAAQIRDKIDQLRIISSKQKIVSNDFERKLEISFGESSDVLSSEIIDCDPKNLNAEIEIINRKVVIKPLLLNAKDYFSIKSIVTDTTGEIDIDTRILGVKKIEEVRYNELRKFIMWFFEDKFERARRTLEYEDSF